MLAALGIDSVDALFEDIPASVRANGLDLPPPEPELLLARRLEGLAGRNRVDLATFLGAGVYRHFIPAAVDQVLSRGEFYTAYTPYQPEISQGTLQTIFEYQSLLAELTGLPVVSASHYDGAAATAEAALMTIRATGRDRVLVSRAVHRHYVDTTRHLPVRTAATSSRSCRRCRTARPTWRRWSERWRTAIIRSPAWCSASPTPSACWSRWPRPPPWRTPPGAKFVAVVEPVSLAVLATPGEYGADIAAGEGQPLGIAPQYGGPYLGVLADHAGADPPDPRAAWSAGPLDLDGRRAYVMTLRAREQDIRRDKAASNICTNQALCALAATAYLAVIGPHGLRDVAAGGRRACPPPGVGAGGRRRAAPPHRAVPQRVRRPRARTPSASTPRCWSAASWPACRWPAGSPTIRRCATRSSCAPRRSPRTRRSTASEPRCARCWHDRDARAAAVAA